MKKLTLILLGLCFITACKNSEKQEAAKEMEEEIVEKTETTADGEWIVLFDGSNLDSWRGYLSDEMHKEWTIDGNAMKFTPGEEGGKNLITKDKYTSFVL